MSAATASVRLRCAVYTRKSSDEGLDQEFNSLDAQYDACQAYIASLASLGWRLVPDRYDDGGISGGTMERPALKRLLQDIAEGRVDVVVVYKIDRLTRSLTDFARMVEIFDKAGASFVSVTQQFNTTTSMGRLTLNVLLSFAQFEREVTAERIRDKIAASKKKGMWMGGNVPLGYRVENRKLLIEQEEAATVRFLFRRYLELKSVRALGRKARDKGLVVRRANPRTGSVTHKTSAFQPGNLYHLLSNPLYVGKIRHRDQVYDGEHEPIIDSETFDAAQALLSQQAPARASSSNQPDAHLLTGLIFDEAGNRLRPVHSSKRGRRYRYYVSKAHVDGQSPALPEWRLPADELDALVAHQIRKQLSDQVLMAKWVQDQSVSHNLDPTIAISRAADLGNEFSASTPSRRRQLARSIISRVELETGLLRITFDPNAIVAHLANTTLPSSRADALHGYIVECAISQRKRGVEKRYVLTDGTSQQRQPDPALVDLVIRSQRYLDRLTDGQGSSLSSIAHESGVEISEVSRALPFAFLAPKLVDALLAGAQPVELTAQRLSRITDLPLAWSDQIGLLSA